MNESSAFDRTEQHPLSAAAERLLAGVVALEAARSFEGNEPAETLGLTSQLIGIAAGPGATTWSIPLVTDAPPVALSDGPLLGRYFVGPERRAEIVVRLSGGRLSLLELDWAGEPDDQWPTPEDITVV